jgi:hypothetical protein
VECIRCNRIVEIQTLDAVRFYGAHTIWKDVGQRLLDNTCPHRTGRHRMAADPGGDDRGPDTPSQSEATSRLVEIALKVKGKMLAPPSGGGDALAESRIEDQGAKRIVILQLSVRVAKNTFQEKPRLGTLGGVFLSMAVPV